MALSEVKLSKKFKIDGWASGQTRFSRHGGCWVGSKLDHCKHIKSLDTNITWFSVAIDYVPIHIISCYLQPQDRRHTTESINRLLFIIEDVTRRIPSSRFIILGNFNENRQEVERVLRSKNFAPLIIDGTPTHRLGGHLDQVFSNFGGTSEIIQIDFSDHVAIKVNIELSKLPSDFDLRSCI